MTAGPEAAVSREEGSVAKAALRRAYHTTLRLLHPARRRLAERDLRTRAPVRSVLFVCHGNVCRSPYAEYHFRRAMRVRGGMIDCRSAGFIGPGREAPVHAIEGAFRRGHDVTAHRSELIEASPLRDADLVVVMAPDQARKYTAGFRPRGRVLVLGDLDTQPIVRRTIQDPWNREPAVFDECFARIERCVERLAELIDHTSTEGKE